MQDNPETSLIDQSFAYECEDDPQPSTTEESPRTSPVVTDEQRYQSCLMLSADSPEELRPQDVDRVMTHAHEHGFLQGFEKWLNSQLLSERTRLNVEQWLNNTYQANPVPAKEVETEPTEELEPVPAKQADTEPTPDEPPIRVLNKDCVSFETGFLQEDYPYGRTLRCKRKVWVELATKGAKAGMMRLCYSTTNPKKTKEVWNPAQFHQYCTFLVAYVRPGTDEYVDQDIIGGISVEKIQSIKEKWYTHLPPDQQSLLDDLEKKAKRIHDYYERQEAKEAEEQALVDNLLKEADKPQE